MSEGVLKFGATKRVNVSGQSKKDDDFEQYIGQNEGDSLLPEQNGGLGWKGILIIIILIFGAATLGLMIWHIVHTHTELKTIHDCIFVLKNETLPALQECVDTLKVCVAQLKAMIPGLQASLDYLQEKTVIILDCLDSIKASLLAIETSFLQPILSCVEIIKNVTLPAIKSCIDTVLIAINQIKDVDLPAVKVCVDYIKSILDPFIANQEAIVGDYRCDDHNPCTSDIYQFGGCMHKYKKCADVKKKDGKSVPVEKNGCYPISCNDACHDPPQVMKKAQFNLVTPRHVYPNGACGIGGKCVPSTPCKGQCTPLMAKKGLYEEKRNTLRGAEVLRNPFLGCPVLPFKIAAQPICQCRKEGACVYRARFNMGANPPGPLDICHNTKYLKKTCLSAFNATTVEEKKILKCLKVTTSCQPFVVKKKLDSEVAPKMGTNFLQCMYHFSCSEILGDLQPISPP